MDLAERFKYAQQEFHKRTKSYFEMLYRIESLKLPSYLYDPINKTLTKIEEPKTDYQIWVENRIEKIRGEMFGNFNIKLNQ